MQKTNTRITVILTTLLALVLITSLVLGGVGMAYAAVDTGSYVLYDLQRDERFNENLYPTIANDFSLQVITIAESSENELFVYVYQPSGARVDLRATSINISKEYKPKKLSFTNYKLTFCNSHKTLYKYKVENFELEDKRTRYYDIPSIFRAWNMDFGDAETGNDNTVSEVAFAVNKIYEMGEKGGEYTVTAVPTNTIEIANKYVGFVRYPSPHKLLGYDAYDSHFVAFSTDIPIDELHSADLYFCTQSYKYDLRSDDNPFGKIKECYLTVDDSELFNFDVSDGWFGSSTINRDRVQTVEDFIATENFSNVYNAGIFNVRVTNTVRAEAEKNLRQCDWVLRFFESEYYWFEWNITDSNGHGEQVSKKESYTIVSDVSILRLEGISNGEEFNLGVVDNKQSGGKDPINDWDMSLEIAGKDFWRNLWRIVKIILCVIAAILLVAFVLWVVRLIATPIKASSKTVTAAKSKRSKRK